MNWSAVKNYENLYEVSDQGQIRSIARQKGLALNPNKDTKYLMVNLWKNNKGKNCYVHRIVAQTFIPNPDGLPEVNHIDGNRQNNCVSNLEWVSRQGNVKHAIRTGLRTYTNRLSEEHFLELLHQVIAGKSYQDLSKEVDYKVPFLSTKIKSIAIKHNLQEELTNALKLQKTSRTIKLNQQQERKPVACYDKEGNLIEQFSSIRDASRKLNISNGAISNAIIGRTKTCKGFIWKSI